MGSFVFSEQQRYHVLLSPTLRIAFIHCNSLQQGGRGHHRGLGWDWEVGPSLWNHCITRSAHSSALSSMVACIGLCVSNEVHGPKRATGGHHRGLGWDLEVGPSLWHHCMVRSAHSSAHSSMVALLWNRGEMLIPLLLYLNGN